MDLAQSQNKTKKSKIGNAGDTVFLGFHNF
jgi:hypothetical protein